MENILLNKALLILEDGTKFYGNSIGAKGTSIGEVIFNTSITGYQEIITDPSYFNQIVAFTYPHIGNIGIEINNNESSKIQVKAVILYQTHNIISDFRNKLSFSRFLLLNNIIGISGIDTRKLTRLIRKSGTQYGYVSSEGTNINFKEIKSKIKIFLEKKNLDLVKLVTTKRKIIYKKKYIEKNFFYNIVAYDFGIKFSIIKNLINLGCRITLVPATTKSKYVISLNPDGILLSNGPGNPEIYKYAIRNIQCLLETKIPIFGICLGHQLLAIANGAKILKMKFGHHGSNHPVKDLETNKIIITSQNHDFAIDKSTLSKNIIITHISMFDQTLQGIKLINKPVFSFQGHPESSPGPKDALFLFKNFINLVKDYRLNKK
ncbi:carA [Wigglesworthia glossinidia endosymbiont of Glossina brevipalpis]|uniref:Carbamoyl phosphate synthase small chain n=1 Tax=Wigglesworthia glossinidia brevipalpis TaxID=36870 RepID=CARA_WIGBR|nr:RecName: Full=Carbamoyl phosphate synthase small chain; AltName: Full=Carbamoyl phosphate synthetase glutamine chain [Wigglesworthia glossinidia endosymbiont of Glossina brevipalpis]BAC24170.1 carA [Wigglesworthia glossinidia endosymbiont of Glossina brevipalpis]